MVCILCASGIAMPMNAISLSINVMSDLLAGYLPPGRICSCRFPVRPAAHICNMGIIVIRLLLN